MRDWGEENLSDDQKKWAEWSMKPKKRQRKPTGYAAGVVIAFTVIVAAGAHQFLLL